MTSINSCGKRSRDYEAAESLSLLKKGDNSLIQEMLSDDLLHHIFSWTDHQTLGRAARCCTRWRRISLHILKSDSHRISEMYYRSLTILFNQPDRAQEILAQFMDINGQDDEGNTALHLLFLNVLKGNIQNAGQILEHLLNHPEIDCNVLNNEHVSPLMIAVHGLEEHKTVVKRLVKMGAYTHVETLWEETLLSFTPIEGSHPLICHEKGREFSKWLISIAPEEERPRLLNSSLYSCLFQDFDCQSIKFLIDQAKLYEIDLTKCYCFNPPLLHWAINNARPDRLDFLLRILPRLKSQIGTVDNDCMLPIDHAISNRNFTLALTLAKLQVGERNRISEEINQQLFQRREIPSTLTLEKLHKNPLELVMSYLDPESLERLKLTSKALCGRVKAVQDKLIPNYVWRRAPHLIDRKLLTPDLAKKAHDLIPSFIHHNPNEYDVPHSLSQLLDILTKDAPLLRNIFEKSVVKKSRELITTSLPFSIDLLPIAILEETLSHENIITDFLFPNADESPLMRIVAYNREDAKDVIDCFLRHGADINFPNFQGETPLSMAAARNNLDMVNFLLEKGAKVNPQVGLKALENGNFKLFLHLHKEGHIDISGWTEDQFIIGIEYVTDNFSILEEATESLDLFLKAYHGEKKRKGMETPHHIAAMFGNITAIQYLLEQKEDITAKTLNGTTPLHLALVNGHLEAAQLIIEKGGDIMNIDKKHRGVVLFALVGGLADFAVELKNQGAPFIADNQLIINLATSSNMPKLGLGQRAVLEKIKEWVPDFDINAQNPTASFPTLLQAVAKQGGPEHLETLLEFGADPEQVGTNNCIALEIAIAGGNWENARILSEAMIQARKANRPESIEMSCEED